MRKRLLYLVVLAISCWVCSVAAFAVEWVDDVQWPPPNYEMPYAVMDTQDYKGFYDAIRASLGSMSGIGINIYLKLLTVTTVLSVVSKFVMYPIRIDEGVKRREFNRAVGKMDFKRNLDEIVDERVRGMEVNYLAKNRFRQKYPGMDLEEALYHRQVSYQADLLFSEQQHDLAIASGVNRRRLSAESDIAFRAEHGELAIQSAFDRRTFGGMIGDMYTQSNHDALVLQSMQRKQINAEAQLEVYKQSSGLHREVDLAISRQTVNGLARETIKGKGNKGR